MADTQPLNIHDASNRFHDAHAELRRAAHAIIDSATIEELRDSAKVAEEMALARSWTADANHELAYLNHRRWSTAMGTVRDVTLRAESAEKGAREWEAECTRLRAQAATDAATISNLREEIAKMMGAPTATPPAAPDGAPRFKVGDKVAADADRSFVCTVTAVHDDGRYSIKDADGVPSRFFWSDDELVAAPKPALRPFDAIVEVNDCTVTMRVTNTPCGLTHHIDLCRDGGLSLRCYGDPGIYDAAPDHVYVWSGENNSKITHRTFPTPAEATSYAEKVRRLLDAANAQWAEKGGQS